MSETATDTTATRASTKPKKTKSPTNYTILVTDDCATWTVEGEVKTASGAKRAVSLWMERFAEENAGRPPMKAVAVANWKPLPVSVVTQTSIKIG